ncbi:MAG: succinate dehydrogenase, hydrophobic membrane anchor protein [Steroidobacteraceae bacterium]
MSLRSPLGQVLGTGSARDGTAHWWAERVTSTALVPLTVWFIVEMLRLPSLDYASVKTLIGSTAGALLGSLTVTVMAYHSYLGTTVIVEDYVHAPGLKVTSLVLLRFAHVLVGGASLFAIMRIAFVSGP